METQVRTPQFVFMQPQRLVVPLFQRPYVWNEENQWEPLWNDLVRVADRILLRSPETRRQHQPHFLGAVVLQQTQNPVGLMQTRTIIDGQQRLTTLQLLLDALHGVLASAGATAAAARIEPLVANAQPFCTNPEDRFKVWPTNRDRPAFNAVMAAKVPVDYDSIGHPDERIVQAHRYFSDQAKRWLLLEAPQGVDLRAAAIETSVRELLQMVVIDLGADENAQEIFETLNARGAQLTAADLIKNFIFQRLLERGTDVEIAYEKHWKEFETGFWENEVSLGRLRYPRSAIFLNHWLIARTGEEVVAREVFDRFKRFADYEAGQSMATLLSQIHAAAGKYREFVMAAARPTGSVDRVGLFGYRTSVMESEVIKPLLLYLLDPEQSPVPDAQLVKALDVVESWMVRRMLVRATTKSYSQVVAELLTQLKTSARPVAGDVIERYLAQQSGDARYWPDDEEIREELAALPAYRRLSRGRLRMLLEAVEDFERGWRDGESALSGERVPRGQYAIEHVMPRKWVTHWALEGGADAEAERDHLIHTIGNLTLLTGKLNSKVSNAPWPGDAGKRAGLEGHDVLFLNRELVKGALVAWTHDSIRQRTRQLTERILKIWPVPSGHKTHVFREKPKTGHKVGVADLVGAGMLSPGMPLFRRRKRSVEQVATLLSDGRIEIRGEVFRSPSDAAATLVGHPTNGWWFFLVDPTSRRSLRAVRSDYIEKLDVDADDEDEGEDESEEDEL